MSKYVTLTAVDTEVDEGSSIQMTREFYDDDTWCAQLEYYTRFLNAQGFIVDTDLIDIKTEGEDSKTLTEKVYPL